MAFNVIGFLLLPFLLKTKIPINWIGNFYVVIGAIAVIILTYFSGGINSGVYPWIISIPILAMLVVDRYSASIWTMISFFVMIWFGYLAHEGVEFPVEYNSELHVIWYVSVLTGLLMIIFVITLVFEDNQSRALILAEMRNEILIKQKEQIAQQTDELKILVEDKDHTTHLLAHDLKNPMASIMSLAEIIKHETTETNRNKYLQMIDEAASNSVDLIEKILKIGELERQKIEISLEQFDLVPLIKNEIEKVKTYASQKNIRLNFESKNPLMIQSDRTFIRQIMENLLSNAIKFSELNKEVDVRIKDQNGVLIIDVTDQGPGLNNEDLKKVFGKFTRLSAQPTGGEKSTGLGLSIVQKYVELLNGRVRCESEVGQGSSFIVEFPMQ
ncbi:MAG: histidine kinase [Reichenbachiella sp.]